MTVTNQIKQLYWPPIRYKRLLCWEACIDDKEYFLFEIKPHKRIRWFLKLHKIMDGELDRVAFFTRSPEVDTVQVSIDAANVYEFDRRPVLPVFALLDNEFYYTQVVTYPDRDRGLAKQLELTNMTALVVDPNLPF